MPCKPVKHERRENGIPENGCTLPDDLGLLCMTPTDLRSPIECVNHSKGGKLTCLYLIHSTGMYLVLISSGLEFTLETLNRIFVNQVRVSVGLPDYKDTCATQLFSISACTIKVISPKHIQYTVSL